MNEDDGGVGQSACRLDLMREEKRRSRREEKRREDREEKKRVDSSTYILLTMSRIGPHVRLEEREAIT